MAAKDRLWKPSAQAWSPKGLNPSGLVEAIQEIGIDISQQKFTRIVVSLLGPTYFICNHCLHHARERSPIFPATWSSCTGL